MEKYGQYRDKGMYAPRGYHLHCSGIAPFFPISPPTSSPLLFPWHLLLFCIRIPIVVFAWTVWLVIVQWMPAGGALRKANQWCVLGIPGVWWIDLQVDGVRRGSLAQGPRNRLPAPGTIIASSYTSPLDVLYLAAIFDPIFTQSQHGSHLVRPITIESALASCFSVLNPLEMVGEQPKSTDLLKLVKQNPNRVIVVFPESTTSNGRGILKLSPSLLSAARETKIYPVSLRYTPADVVTPIPGWLEAARFIWRLNSRQTHCIRVRIGGPITLSNPGITSAESSPAPAKKATPARNGIESNYFDTLQASPSFTSTENSDGNDLSPSERQILDAVADSLARLGRVKRVDLGVEEKSRFVEVWGKGRKRK